MAKSMLDPREINLWSDEERMELAEGLAYSIDPYLPEGVSLDASIVDDAILGFLQAYVPSEVKKL